MWDVWRLHRKRRKIVARADKERTAALKVNDMVRANEIAVESFLQCQSIDQRLDRFLDTEIRQEAQELDIEFPPLDDLGMWHRDTDHSLFLKFRGRAYLRERIDKEKTRRFEVKTLWITRFWLPLLAGVVGLIGAATGFIAVWRHGK